MPTPNISSRLPSSSTGGGADNQNQNDVVDQQLTRTDTPKGLLVMVAGPSSKGPLEPVLLETLTDAESVYGTGPLVDDIGLALQGARTGASATGNQLQGHVLALRTDTGTPATATVQNVGQTVFNIRTATSGTDANDWTLDFQESKIVVSDPETDRTYEFTYSNTGLFSNIETPSDFAQALTNFTSGRLIAEAVRGDAHFEMSVHNNASGDAPVFVSASTSDETVLDFAGVTSGQMATSSGLTNANHVIGDNTPFFSSGTEPAVHNDLIPEDAEFERFYAVTAGSARVLGRGNARHQIAYLGDRSRLDVPTKSLLNLHIDNSQNEGPKPLNTVGERDGSQVAEAWMRVRDYNVGRLDRTKTDEVGADFTVKYVTSKTDLPFDSGSATADIDGNAVEDEDLVFVFGTENDGIYTVVETASGGSFYLDSGPGSKVTVNKGDTVRELNTDPNPIVDKYHKYQVNHVVKGIDPDVFTEPDFGATYAIEGMPGSESAIDTTLTTLGASADDKVFVYASGDATNNDGIYKVVDESGTLKLSDRRSVANSRLENSTIEVVGDDSNPVESGDLDPGYYSYEATLADAKGAEVVVFNMPAPHGVADGGPLAGSYEDAMGATPGQLSNDRIAPTGVQKFESAYAVPQPNSPDGIEVSIAPITDPSNPQPYEGDLQVEWSDGMLTLYFDEQETEGLDDGLIYVSYDSCIFDLREVSDLSQASSYTDYAVQGQTVVFGAALDHDLVVRPLRVTQYNRGDVLEIERTVAGNKFKFVSTGLQPGPEGGPISDIETIIGFEYEYEPSFPTNQTVSLDGGTQGMDAPPDVKANALEQALQEYGKRDHSVIVAAGLHVDEMIDSRDPMTGAKVNRPVGVLDVLRRHQDRMSAGGASPVVCASLRPMQPSTTSGRYTDRQKEQRVREITEPPASGEVNTYSIIQRQSMPEAFIFDAPIQRGGRVREAAAYYAGLRSTLGNETTLYDVPLGIEAAYRYDVVGQAQPSRLSDGRVNTWSPLRGRNHLADDRTAADPVADRDWRSGTNLMAAKEFQQEGVKTLRNLLGSIPSGGIPVLRASTESMLRGIAQRVTGVQSLEFNGQTDIKFDVKDGSTLGMRVTPGLRTNGELRSIELSVSARADFGGISSGPTGFESA